MTDSVPQRESWNGRPEMLGEGWRLRKVVCGHPRQAASLSCGAISSDGNCDL